MNPPSWRWVGIGAIVALAPLVALGQPSTDTSAETLARTLKPYLIEAMPKVLYEKIDNWDHQVMVPVGVKWRGLKPMVTKSLRNHGEWKKLIVTSQDLPRTLDLKISDFKTIDADRQTFKVHLRFQMGVHYEQQNWESGARLWSGSVRARTQLKIEMDCENTLRVEIGKDLLPDFILRIRVTNAKVHYDNLVVEHINGIGGTGAKLIGQAAHDAMKQWRPSIERDLLARAGASIVKTADTREVRLGFGNLVKTK